MFAAFWQKFFCLHASCCKRAAIGGQHRSIVRCRPKKMCKRAPALIPNTCQMPLQNDHNGCPPSSPRRFSLPRPVLPPAFHRSEEHTSELQSLTKLLCRLLLGKKKKHLPGESGHHLEPRQGRDRNMHPLLKIPRG